MVRIDGIRLAVFDLDDTLYPESEFAEEGFGNVAELLAKGNAALAEGLVSKMKSLAQAGRRGEIFQVVLADLGQPVTQERVAELVDVYRTSDRRLSLFPDAARAIRRFREAGISLAILTDGPLAGQQTKVRLLELERQFDQVVYTDSYGSGFSKPSARCFEMLMREFKAEAGKCVYIADNERKDFFGPNSLGWCSVQVLRPGGVYDGCKGEDERYKARYCVGSLDDVELTLAR